GACRAADLEQRAGQGTTVSARARGAPLQYLRARVLGELDRTALKRAPVPVLGLMVGAIEWAEALARLDGSKPHSGLTERRWRQVLDDAGRFLDRWAHQAAGLGWSAADLFCTHPQALDRGLIFRDSSGASRAALLSPSRRIPQSLRAWKVRD